MLSRGRSLLFSIIAFFVFAGLLIVSLKMLPGLLAGYHIEPLSELSQALIFGLTAVLALVIALVVFRKRGLAQKIRIFFTMFLFTFSFAAIGNFVSQKTISLPNLGLIVNWVEAVIMLLGGSVCTVLAYMAGAAEAVSTAASGATRPSRNDESGATRRVAAPATDDVKNEGKAEGKAEGKPETKTGEKPEAQLETGERTALRGQKAPSGTKIPAMPGKELKPKNAMSNSASNLRGMLDSLAPDDDEKPAPAKAADIAAKADAVAKKALEASKTPAKTSGTGLPASGSPDQKKPSTSAQGIPEQKKPGTSATGIPAQKPSSSGTGIPEQRKPTASSTATRLQAQKRKSTSTFIKLQALSSSGTGASRPKTADTAGTDASESLKSILDRLDSSDDSDIDFFGSESLLDKTDVADKNRISKTSIPAVNPKSSNSAIPAAGTRTSNTSMPPINPGAAITPPAGLPRSSGTTPAKPSTPATPTTPAAPAAPTPATPTPVTPAAPTPAVAASKSSVSMKASDTSIPALGSVTPTPLAAKTEPPAAPAAPAAESKQEAAPSLTDMLNSIKTPELKAIEAGAAAKAERPVGGLGGSGLGGTGLARVAGKKTGIALGRTSSTNLNKVELPPESALEPAASVAATADTAANVVPENTVQAPPETPIETPAEAAETIVETVIEQPPVVEEVANQTPELPVETPAELITESIVEPAAEFSAAPAPEVAAEVQETPAPSLDETYSESISAAAAQADSFAQTFVDSFAETATPQTFSAAPKAESTPDLAIEKPKNITELETFAAEPAVTESFKPESFTPAVEPDSFESFESANDFASSNDAMLNFAADQSETEAEAEAEAEDEDDAPATLFESAAVDQEIEDIFSNLVPPEAQQEVNEATLSHTRLPALDPLQAQSILNQDEEEEEKLLVAPAAVAPPLAAKPAPEVEPTPTPATPAPATPAPATPAPAAPAAATPTPATPAPATPAPAPVAEEVSNTLFESAAVDQEIEDIFSNLVPPEAQQVVNEATLSHNRLQAMDQQEAKALLHRDDEAKNTPEVAAKAEAKSAVAAPAPVAPPAPEVKEPVVEKKEESIEEEKKEGLFDPTLDQEIDEIFHSLAPEEALAEVTDESLARVKSAELGEMSFAPGDQSESEREEPAAQPAAAATPTPTPAPAAAPAATAAPVTEAETTVSAAPAKASSESFAPPQAPAAASNSNQAINLIDSLEENNEGGEAKSTPEPTPPQVSVSMAEQIKSEAIDIEPAATASIGTEAAAADTAAAAEADEAPAANKPKEVKEFGRLSAKSASAGANSEVVGTMKTIGKLLIDVPAIENIIKTGETGTIGKNLATARVISTQRGEGINALLKKIDAYPGIAGTLIVGHDGLVISSTLKADKDKDTIGALSVACLGSTNLGTRKLEIGKLKQMVFITDSTITVLTDVEVGILAVLLDHLEINKIDGVLQAIHDTIHG